MRKQWTSYGYMGLAMALAGSSVVVGKMIVDVFPVFLSQVITLSIAVVVIFPIAWMLEGNPFRYRIRPMAFIYLFLQAVTGMFLFRVFLLWGLQYTTGASAGIVTSMGPAVLGILSYILLHQRIQRRGWLGILICVGGVLAINIRHGSGDGSGQLLGNALILCAVVGEGLFTIFRKKSGLIKHPVTDTMLVMIFALILFLIFSWVRGEQLTVQSLQIRNFLPLAYYGIFCSALAYICWFKGVADASMASAAGMTAVMPVVSVVLSAVVLGESIGVGHVIGMVLVLVGILVIARQQVRTVKDDEMMSPSQSIEPAQDNVIQSMDPL